MELVLSGVSITSESSAAIYAKQADKTIITLFDGTQNTLTDASNYQYADASEDEPSAALFSKDDLVIRGSGSLTVYGNYQNGITAKDDLVIEGGTITVQAVNHGLRGKDSVTVLGGAVTIDAGDDGIQSDNTADSDKGTILIAGGTLEITSVHDGIQAQTAISVTGGEIIIQAGGGYTVESYSAQESYKGLKSAGTVYISDGEITVNSLDDAIHAGTAVTVSAAPCR